MPPCHATSSPLDHVVVVAHGPARVLKSAVRRARALLGADGSVSVLATSTEARKIAGRLTSAYDHLVEPSDLTAHLFDQPTDRVLLLHDDASLNDAALNALAVAHPSQAIVLAHHGIDVGAIGPAGEIAAITEIGPAGATFEPPALRVDELVHHEGRCSSLEPMASADPTPPLIVASLIVKDEADHLADCLASVGPFVDAVVVCDTGSRDDTVEIARRAGATVIERAWCDDFAWARNEALAAVPVEAGWVLWIDADERLDVEHPAIVRTALRGSSLDAIAIPVQSSRMDGPTTTGVAQRLFRRGHASFTGAIHEELIDVRTGGPLATDTVEGIKIVHLGYDGTAQDRVAKAARNLAIATAQFERNPDPKAALDLVRSLAYADEHRAALDLALTSLSLADADDPRAVRLTSVAAGLALELAEHQQAFELAGEALDRSPGDDVAAATYAVAGHELGHHAAVVERITGLEAHQGTSLQVPQNRELATRVAEASAQELSGQIAEAPIAAPADSSGGGISLSFALDPTPCPPTILAQAAGPRRRVLEWTSSAELTELLTANDSAVTSQLGDAHLAERLDELADHSFDIIIGGISEAIATETLRSVKRLLDPSGRALLWDVDLGGTPITGIAAPAGHTLSGPDADALIGSIGFDRDPLTPLGVNALRPTVDAATQIAETAPPSAQWSLTISSEEPLPEELQLAYRVSLPSSIALRFAGEPANDEPTLFTDTTLLPDPRWVQALWDHVVLRDEAAGVRVVDDRGTCIHAGFDDQDRPIGRGDGADVTFLRSDRSQAALGLPWMTPPGQSDPRGRMLSSSVAVQLGGSDDAVPGSFGPRDRRVVLMLDGPAPGTGDPQLRDVVDDVLARLTAAGSTPVYQWGLTQEPVDPHVAQRWRSLGVILVPPSPERLEVDTFRPDIGSPRSDALAAAFDPEIVVHMTRESLEWDFHSIAGRAGRATIVSCGLTADRFADRADVTCAPGDLVDVVTGLERSSDDHAITAPMSGPRRIPPIRQTPGLVSIVIPVHNRWDLTSVCLQRIAEHTSVDHEIIVVDNGSTDATAKQLRSMDVSVIVNEENRGFPIAVNQGIGASHGEFICVLNNDTEVTQGWLDRLLAGLAIDGTGMVGPRSNRIAGLQQIPEGPAPTDEGAHEWAATWRAAHVDQTWCIDRLIGFCLVLRRDTLETHGGFDEGFGIGNHEDDELGNRLMSAGLDLRVVDDAVVLHHGSATFAALELDYMAILHQSSRHLSSDASNARGTTAIVLSNGDSLGAAASAATSLRIADRVRVVERTALVSTQIAAAAVRGGRVEVIAADWTTDEGAAAAFAGIETPRTLVLGAGELVECADWGSARAELEAVGQTDTGVRTNGGVEVRVVPPRPDAVAAVGAPAERDLVELQLR